ncbi:DUF4389 domain-containing protein [Paeniglutamicibacter sp.]|uniref:DUF4389 domain-containing protein n=1 Tax=Paeniglutamicibacter sp. TaxID=1934391 RepID=UPI003988A588
MASHAAPPFAPLPSPPARMKPGHWVLLVLGVLLSTLGLGLAIGGAVTLGADAAQRDGRYLVGDTERYRSTGYALTSPSVVLDPGSEGMRALPQIGDLASIHVRVANVVPDQEIFVGIAEASDVEAYLQDVARSSLGDTTLSSADQWPGRMSWLKDNERTTAGNRVPAAPGEQDFWTASASGPGSQEISWDLEPGRWALVVMNADASAPVWVDLQAGARSDLLGPIGTGLLVAGLIALVLGIPLLLLGTAGLGRDIDAARPRTGQGPGAALAEHAGRGKTPFSVYPLRFSGVLDERLSRGLWLVKWLLAVPHYIVLALLWVGLVVTTIAAGVAILFTGRYPRSWFCYNVGVLRWSWRVGFYGYSALGTDRYPPFTLASADYPADLDVAYPQRLSRGLVLVKWWLLAIPHLLVIGIFTSGTGATWSGGWEDGAELSSNTWGPSLLGLLVLVAAVLLLFTGRYWHGLFALIMGVNRWVYRVSAYVLLMRDEYPPFRLDQGPLDPTAAPPDGQGTVEGNGTPEPGNQPPVST